MRAELDKDKGETEKEPEVGQQRRDHAKTVSSRGKRVRMWKMTTCMAPKSTRCVPGRACEPTCGTGSTASMASPMSMVAIEADAETQPQGGEGHQQSTDEKDRRRAAQDNG